MALGQGQNVPLPAPINYKLLPSLPPPTAPHNSNEIKIIESKDKNNL